MRDYISMRERADELGYMHMSCSLCGWHGWTDTGVCEGCVSCDECGKTYTEDRPCACCRECGYSLEENRCICNNEQEKDMSKFLYDFTWDGDCLQGVWCGLDGVQACVEALAFRRWASGCPGACPSCDHTWDPSVEVARCPECWHSMGWFDDSECLGTYYLASDIKLAPGDSLVINGEPIYGTEAQAQLQRLQKIEEHGTHIPSEAHIEQEKT